MYSLVIYLFLLSLEICFKLLKILKLLFYPTFSLFFYCSEGNRGRDLCFHDKKLSPKVSSSSVAASGVTVSPQRGRKKETKNNLKHLKQSLLVFHVLQNHFGGFEVSLSSCKGWSSGVLLSGESLSFQTVLKSGLWS